MNLKKYLGLMVVACFSFVFLANGVNATDGDVVTTKTSQNGKTMVFANGHSITIEAKADDTEGATVKWRQPDGQEREIDVDADSIIFGGSDAATAEDMEELYYSDITMNGGKVAYIFGGGLNYSDVEDTRIEITGGTVTGAVYGGGADSENFNTKVATSTSTVVDAYISIEGGTINKVYGGGSGKVDESYIRVTGGQITDLVVGGNTHPVGEAGLYLYGGKVTNLQPVENETVNDLNISIEGGEVTNLYVTSKDADKTYEEGEIAIISGKVDNLKLGSGTPTSDSVVYEAPGIVTNKDANLADKITIKNLIQLTFVSKDEEGNEYRETVPFPAGTSLGELLKEMGYDTIEDMKKDAEGFLGFRILGTEEYLKEDYVINSDVTIELVFGEEAVKTPKTLDPIYGYASMTLVGLFALGLATKKIFF